MQFSDCKKHAQSHELLKISNFHSQILNIILNFIRQRVVGSWFTWESHYQCICTTRNDLSRTKEKLVCF
jgi:hypothetical protein